MVYWGCRTRKVSLEASCTHEYCRVLRNAQARSGRATRRDRNRTGAPGGPGNRLGVRRRNQCSQGTIASGQQGLLAGGGKIGTEQSKPEIVWNQLAERQKQGR